MVYSERMRHIMRAAFLQDSLEKRAHTVATLAHINQRRKYTGEPYITHPKAVASIVKSITTDPVTICAAYLHDVIEDTDVKEPELRHLFGSEITRVVLGTTKVSKAKDRTDRAAENAEHYASACPRAQTIKVADMLHNCPSIIMFDPVFAQTYMAEKRALLALLTDANPALVRKAQQMFSNYYKENK